MTFHKVLIAAAALAVTAGMASATPVQAQSASIPSTITADVPADLNGVAAQTVGFKKFGHRRFGRRNFGNRNFGNRRFGRRHFGNRSFGRGGFFKRGRGFDHHRGNFRGDSLGGKLFFPRAVIIK